MDHQYPPPPVYASAQPTPGNGNLETGHVAVYPPPPPPLARGLPVTVSQQQLVGEPEGHDPNALLVGTTVITMLAFMLGTFIPGGYWEHSMASSSDGKVVYHAGDPIMRDLHRPRYWVFRVATWVGVASSMVLTLSLLLRMAADSRHVRWSFAVAYSSLLLTFAVSQTKTHLSLDIIVWLAVLVVSWLITRNNGEKRARIMQLLCCGSRGN
ncbi:hypothetical protein HU200_044483 [Digitaria exilis]|uniref:PGG domain-containing protein n=1 Tax=Digitaria exilis TaxID=1010633 RepID=A0A835B0X3_9POAL|nr:hypothetical protein HU200_044483 [Digitaria exilis]CAB3496459.1 unnamed protein product [Digitaria exilis]